MRRWLMGLAVAAAAIVPSVCLAIDDPRETHTEKMAADLLVARPVGVFVTVLGGAAFLVSLPFSLIGGNTDQAFEALFLGPARETFARCLGCSSVKVRRVGTGISD